MSIKVFSSEFEFKQDAIMLVARLTFDIAVDVIGGGNVADDSESVLSYLLDMAKQESLNKRTQDAISFYLDSVIEHNRELIAFYDK